MQFSQDRKSNLKPTGVILAAIGVAGIIGSQMADMPSDQEALTPIPALRDENKTLSNSTSIVVTNSIDQSAQEKLAAFAKELVYDCLSMEVTSIGMLGPDKVELSAQDIRKLLQNLEKNLSPELFAELKSLQSSGLLPNILLKTIDDLYEDKHKNPEFNSELVKQVLAISKRVTTIMESCGLNDTEIAALFSNNFTTGNILETFMQNGELPSNLKTAAELTEKYPKLAQQMERQIELTLTKNHYKLIQRAKAQEIDIQAIPKGLSLKEKVELQRELETELYRFDSFADALKVHGLTNAETEKRLLDLFFDSTYKKTLNTFREQTSDILSAENDLRKARGIVGKNSYPIFGNSYSPENDGPLQPETIQSLAQLRTKLLGW
jgi:hypothetical protein